MVSSVSTFGFSLVVSWKVTKKSEYQPVSHDFMSLSFGDDPIILVSVPKRGGMISTSVT